MKRDFTSVDEYIATQPAAVKAILSLVRKTILEALPEALEVISYKMPAYKVKNDVVLYFAAWKRHYSLYPAGDRLVAAFGDELAAYDVSKGTIRLPLSEPVPVQLIARIARFRQREVSERRE